MIKSIVIMIIYFIYSECIYNLKIFIRQFSKMQNKQLDLYPILNPWLGQEFIQNQHQINELEAEITIKNMKQEIYGIRVVSEVIMLYKGPLKSGACFAFIRLSLDLKLQLFLTAREHTRKKELKGLSLIDKNGQTITFLFKSISTAQLWVRMLSKRLFQSDFHHHYKILRKYGQGGSALVYETVRMSDGCSFAVKALFKQSIKNDQKKLNIFCRQLELMRSLNHKNIVKIEALYETENNYLIVMENLKGGNMLNMLFNRTTMLSSDEIRQIMRGILEGLAQLQRLGIVHRDIKLDNIMLRDGDHFQPVIVDFGIAVWAVSPDYYTYRCGTPGYISPQVINSNKETRITSSSDVFSAGVILHVLLTSHYLFEGQDRLQIIQKNKEFSFNFDNTLYKDLDANALNLLKSMLTLDESRRIKATQCILHPFLTKQGSKQFIETQLPDVASREYINQI